MFALRTCRMSISRKPALTLRSLMYYTNTDTLMVFHQIYPIRHSVLRYVLLRATLRTVTSYVTCCYVLRYVLLRATLRVVTYNSLVVNNSVCYNGLHTGSGDKSPGDKSPGRSIFSTFNTLFLGKNKLKQLKLHKNKATVRRIE